MLEAVAGKFRVVLEDIKLLALYITFAFKKLWTNNNVADFAPVEVYKDIPDILLNMQSSLQEMTLSTIFMNTGNNEEIWSALEKAHGPK